MKKLFIALIVFMISCKTTRIDSKTGDRNPTAVKRHADKVHPLGFWTGKKYIITNPNLIPVKVTK